MAQYIAQYPVNTFSAKVPRECINCMNKTMLHILMDMLTFETEIINPSAPRCVCNVELGEDDSCIAFTLLMHIYFQLSFPNEEKTK